MIGSATKLSTLAKAVAKVGRGVVSCGVAYWGEAPSEVVKVKPGFNVLWMN